MVSLPVSTGPTVEVRGNPSISQKTISPWFLSGLSLLTQLIEARPEEDFRSPLVGRVALCSPHPPPAEGGSPAAAESAFDATGKEHRSVETQRT